MSKAFTRESDESGAEEIPSFRPRLPPGVTNYITPEGVERLKERLNALLEKKEALTAASNGAAAAAEADQRKFESAIRNLPQVLDSVVLAEILVDQECSKLFQLLHRQIYDPDLLVQFFAAS